MPCLFPSHLLEPFPGHHVVNQHNLLRNLEAFQLPFQNARVRFLKPA